MFKWIKRYSAGVRFNIWLSIVLGVIQVGSTLWFVWSCKRVIDIATGAISTDISIGVSMMIAAILIEVILGAITSRIEKMSAIKLQNKIRNDSFHHILWVDWLQWQKLHSGDVMNRIQRDIKDTTEFICSSLPTFVVTLFQFIASFLFLITLDARLAWVLVGIVPLFLLLSKLYFRRMKQLTHAIRKSDSEIHSHIQESIQHTLLIKTHRSQEMVSDVLSQLQNVLWGQTLTHTRFSTFSRAMISLGFACGYIVAFTYGAYQIKDGLITYGVMTAFLQLVGRIQRPLAQLSSIIPQFISASTAADRLDELHLFKTEKMGADSTFASPCGVKIDKITFGYKLDDRKIFECFSYDFAPSTRTAIVGESGSGKSTLSYLILSLIKPQSGRITMYNSSEESEASSLTRSEIIYVSQDNALFSGTIRYNLLLGNNNATEEMMHKVLYTAAAEFVFDLPDGLDSICGESGILFSQGQAQRISIARALLGKGSILLLDEATSALDRTTEKELIRRLMVDSASKTVIFITHRKEVAQLCDAVVELYR